MSTRSYRITLTAVGPVHIGTGEKMGGKDYFLQRDGVAVLNVPSFIEHLSPGQLDAYCSFLDGDSRTGLEDFLQKAPEMRRIAEKCIAYEVDTRPTKARRGTYQYFEVAKCIKDAYGRPYVPGSSMKGMLRTAILASIVATRRKEILRLYGEHEASKQIDRSVFWLEHPDSEDPNVANDIMRYVSISDSEPLEIEDLVFAKKYDKFAKTDNGRHKRNMDRLSDDTYFEGNELNIYRECIKPGASITLPLNIDSRIDNYLPFDRLDAQRLQLVIRQASDLYEKCFLNAFDIDADSKGKAPSDNGRCRYVYQSGPFVGRRCRNHAVNDTGYCNQHQDSIQQHSSIASANSELTCYLGGGVGFNSKAIVSALFEEDSERRLSEISRILYRQFPTRIDKSRHGKLWDQVKAAGFIPKEMAAYRHNGKLKKAKDDHRHWRDYSLGVSPHTLKLAIIGNRKYPMGKCHIKIEEQQ